MVLSIEFIHYASRVPFFICLSGSLPFSSRLISCPHSNFEGNDKWILSIRQMSVFQTVQSRRLEYSLSCDCEPSSSRIRPVSLVLFYRDTSRGCILRLQKLYRRWCKTALKFDWHPNCKLQGSQNYQNDLLGWCMLLFERKSPAHLGNSCRSRCCFRSTSEV